MNQRLHRFDARGTFGPNCASGIVSGVVFWFAVRILLHYSNHPALRKSALAMLAIIFARIFLGFLLVASGALTMSVRRPEAQFAALGMAVAS